MSFCTRVALVTGANKGIGFAISRDLCRQFPGDVVLTSRDAARGQAAVQQLQAEGLSPRFHLLDIEDPQSIRALRDFLLKEYGGLDVLVNNAGIAFKSKEGAGCWDGRRGGHAEHPQPGWAGFVWRSLLWGGLLLPSGPEWLPREGGSVGGQLEQSPAGIGGSPSQRDLCVSLAQLLGMFSGWHSFPRIGV